MGLLLVVVFLVLPFAELAVIVGTADAVGLGWTFLALVAFSLAGAFLVRREGSVIWRRANDELAQGRMPARQLLDGALVMAGGALLLTPGFITDAVGLAMLFPPSRALMRPLLIRFMSRRATLVVGGFGNARGSGGAGAGSRADAHEASARPSQNPPASARVIDLEVDPPPGSP